MNQRAIQGITDFIFMDDHPEVSDIIFVPGTSKSAITEKAAQLYCSGFAKYVLPSGMYSSSVGRFAIENIDNPRYAGHYTTDCEYCKHILMENGVPETAIICEERATNSMENAMFSAEILNRLGIDVKKAIICCQSFHARRAFMSYSLYFPTTEFLIVPTDTQDISKENWILNEKSYRKVMSEVSKCGKYFINYELIIENKKLPYALNGK